MTGGKRGKKCHQFLKRQDLWEVNQKFSLRLWTIHTALKIKITDFQLIKNLCRGCAKPFGIIQKMQESFSFSFFNKTFDGAIEWIDPFLSKLTPSQHLPAQS